MYEFIINNSHTLLTIYLVGYVLTFLFTMIFFRWCGKAEDEDREIYPEAYAEESLSIFSSWIVWLIMSALLAFLWMFAPVVFMGLILFDVIRKKFPELMGDDGEDSEEEQNSD